MRLRPVYGALLALLAATLAAGCATAPSDRPEPVVRVVETKVPQPVPCPALAQLGPEPAYPDTDQAITNAPSIGARAKLYVAGRKMRIQRLAEYAAASLACQF
jgi:hypothetical protein